MNAQAPAGIANRTPGEMADQAVAGAFQRQLLDFLDLGVQSLAEPGQQPQAGPGIVLQGREEVLLRMETRAVGSVAPAETG